MVQTEGHKQEEGDKTSQQRKNIDNQQHDALCLRHNIVSCSVLITYLRRFGGMPTNRPSAQMNSMPS